MNKFLRFKKLGLLCLACAAFMTVKAEVTDMIVTLKDGSQWTFTFADKPVVTCQRGMFVVKTATDEKSTELADIDNYCFKANSSADLLEADKARLGYAMGQLTVSGLQAGTVVYLYSLDGMLVASTQADADGRAVLDMNGCQNGVYIVKANEMSWKIINN